MPFCGRFTDSRMMNGRDPHNEHTFDPPDGMYVRFDPRTIAANPWVTTRRHTYSSSITRVTVPKGFACDLASVPSWLLWLFGPSSRHQRAAVFHDAGYRLQYASRFEIDALFRSIMAADRVVL